MEPGFAKWRIVHAEFEGDDRDTFVAHLRSGKSRKFVLRCDIDSDDYGSIDDALGIDGDPERIIGDMLQMSTNRSGAKKFLRAAPLAWTEAEIIGGEQRADGGANVKILFGDDKTPATFTLGADEAEQLVVECGGEAEAIGSKVRYRLLPDNTLEFRRQL